jgi:hypothetical protein
MLDERDRGGGSVRDLVVDEPEVVLAQDVAARLVDSGGPEDRAGLGGVRAARAQRAAGDRDRARADAGISDQDRSCAARR